MKDTYRVLGNLVSVLPLLYVLVIWDHLPEKVPVHFTETGQADQFSCRLTWLWTLVNMFILLLVFRSSVFFILTKPATLPLSRIIALYLLTAALVGSILLTYVLQTTLRTPVYARYLPVLMAFFGAALMHFSVVIRSPGPAEQTAPLPNRRKAALTYIQALSKFVMVRVNLLVGGLMLFSAPNDRWLIGILANVLGFGVLLVIAYRQLKEAR